MLKAGRAGARGRRRGGRGQRHAVRRRRGRGRASTLNKEMQSRVTDKSVAYIGSVSLLGEGALDITPALGGVPIPPGGYVKTKQTPGQLADVAESATQSLKEATRAHQGHPRGEGHRRQAVHRRAALQGDLRASSMPPRPWRPISKQGRGSAGKLLNEDALYDSLEASIGNIRTLTDRINRGEGSLGQADERPRLRRLGRRRPRGTSTP